MEQIIIEIHACDEGYMYTIHPDEASLEQGDGLGGGVCTSDMATALNSAMDMAKDLLKKSLKAS